MAPRNLPSTLPKCAVACEFCRAKKIKCDGKEPCENCVSHKKEGSCYYPPPNPRPRRNVRESYKVLQDRLHRAEALLHAAGLHSEIQMPACGVPAPGQGVAPEEALRVETFISSNSQLPDVCNASMDGDATDQFQRLPLPRDAVMQNVQQQAFSASSQNIFNLKPPENPQHQEVAQMSCGRNSVETSAATPVISHQQQLTVSDSDRIIPRIEYGDGKSVRRRSIVQHTNFSSLDNGQLQSPATTVSETESSNSLPRRKCMLIYEGPGSLLSICSNAGIKWVSERTGLSDFSSSATSLASFVTRSLKLQTRTSRLPRVQEPDAEVAQKYCQVFFDECFEGTFNLFHRPTFEDRLNKHVQNPEEIDDDPAWYALRNIVYAFGSRFCINREPPTTGWLEAQTHSWQYFQNAFSVHSDLVYSWSSILTVQALLAMALFVEGVGAPKIEYMLINNALQLARSKGLSMQPSPPRNISEAEKQERNWLFWSIYVYEKHVCFRSGRPSAIDDDDIDCAVPESSPDGNPNRAEVFRHIVWHAQISSAVMKDLFSAKSRQKTPAVITKTVQDLEERLQHWRQNLPSYLKPDSPITLSNLPLGIFAEHKMWIYLSYYGTLSVIHSVFSCPWISPGVDYEQDSIVRDQRDCSITRAAEAARKIILATRSIAADAAAPTWLTFLFPFMGTLNLFTYIIRFPTLPSVANDIDLLDIAVGYFGYLAFTTQSHISVSFIKELPQWARIATKTTLIPHQVRLSENFMPSTATSSLADSNSEPSYDFRNMAMYDLGFDDWPNFFSSIG